MTPEEITAAANALVTATQDAAVNAGQNIEANAAQLAPDLATGSNAPGGYNYQRNIAPTVPALTDQFVVNAKQSVLRDFIRDLIYGAQTNLDAARSGYRARQRAFQQRQAQRARERQAEDDRRYSATVAAQNALAGSSGAGIGGVRVTPTTPAPRLQVAPVATPNVVVQPLPPQPSVVVRPLPPQPRIVVR